MHRELAVAEAGAGAASAPFISTLRGLRDRAILAVLVGCGLRRSEAAALTMAHVKQRDGRWCIVDLVGKHGRVRTAPMPTWVKVAVNAWASPTGVAEGYVFRPVNRADCVTSEALGEKVVWRFITPHQALRRSGRCSRHRPSRSPSSKSRKALRRICRTCAKLCRAGGELEQIQLLLGHASVQMIERYLGTKQDLIHAPNEAIKLRVIVLLPTCQRVTFQGSPETTPSH
jgi:integrase/recombinase XerD